MSKGLNFNENDNFIEDSFVKNNETQVPIKLQQNVHNPLAQAQVHPEQRVTMTRSGQAINKPA